MGDGYAAEPGLVPSRDKEQEVPRGGPSPGGGGGQRLASQPLGLGSCGVGSVGTSDLPPSTGTSAQRPRPLARRCASATG